MAIEPHESLGDWSSGPLTQSVGVADAGLPVDCGPLTPRWPDQAVPRKCWFASAPLITHCPGVPNNLTVQAERCSPSRGIREQHAHVSAAYILPVLSSLQPDSGCASCRAHLKHLCSVSLIEPLCQWPSGSCRPSLSE